MKLKIANIYKQKTLHQLFDFKLYLLCRTNRVREYDQPLIWQRLRLAARALLLMLQQKKSSHGDGNNTA